MRVRTWMVVNLYDRHEFWRCVFVCSSTMREREVFWGNWGMSDGNDLIEEQIKMKMSD